MCDNPNSLAFITNSTFLNSRKKNMVFKTNNENDDNFNFDDVSDTLPVDRQRIEMINDRMADYVDDDDEDENKRIFADSLNGHIVKMDNTTNNQLNGKVINQMNKQPPSPASNNSNLIDRYNFVYIVLLLHGIAMLMPWNMFINATEYFTDYKLTIQLNNGTKIESKYKEYFLSNLGIASQVPNVLFNILNIFFQFGNKSDPTGGFNIRILGAIFIELIFIIITVLLAWIDTNDWVTTFFYLTMVTVIILNMVNAIYQNSFYGLGSRLPMRYTNAIVTGTNVCGTFTSLINIATIAMSPNKRIAAIYFFTSAIVVLFLAFTSFFMLKKNKYFLYYLRNTHLQQQPTTTITIDGTTETEMKTKTTTENQNLLTTTTDSDRDLESKEKISDKQQPKSERPPYLYVFRFVWKQCLNVFLVFFVTLATFPVIQSDIRPINPEYFGSKELTDKYYVAVACFLVFNSCALFGNLVPNFVIFPGPDKLWIPVVSRFLFIPFFMLCNYAPNRRQWPVLIQSDLLYLFGSILMGFSSGYYSSLCMMYTPQSVPDPKLAGTAGMMAAASLICGIFLGVNFSSVLAWFIRQ
ncbi:equilibrative nucleoside transporter 1 isoform X1 [Dermatophagoides farinae]|uniref:equilibrative nucleoside transporter 1 isoform X1 n=2 Tax=Dermatophagoides farinae TaxID=6954 RepID=UPI003F5D7739